MGGCWAGRRVGPWWAVGLVPRHLAQGEGVVNHYYGVDGSVLLEYR
jgi:hypothetical protein